MELPPPRYPSLAGLPLNDPFASAPPFANVAATSIPPRRYLVAPRLTSAARCSIVAVFLVGAAGLAVALLLYTNVIGATEAGAVG